MPLDPKRVQSVFLSAVECHEPAARAAVLDRECSTDVELRRRVEALLTAHDQPDSLLDQPIVGPARHGMEPVTRADHNGREGVGAESAINTSEGSDPTLVRVLDADSSGDGGDTTFEVANRAVPTISGYEILGELGRGGMGVVYRARQILLNRPCVLKMILGGSHAGDEATVRFLAEAEAVARLQHPNIVQIHNIGQADGLPFFELEYIDGGSLDGRLVGTPWPAKRAATLVEALANGVAEAHRLGIVHRDLKPGNILLMADGTPKITDFGLAKSVTTDSGLTATDSIMGSPSYMAPEQAEGKTKHVGPPADVYALGAILYDLLTGRPPFRGASVLETLEQVKTTEPVPPSRLVPRLPRDVETIALKCLQKEPGKRYDSAAILAEDLRRFLGGEPIVARPVPPWERAWRWCRRHPAPATLSAAVVVVAALGLSGILWQWGEALKAEGRATTERDRAVAAVAQARAEGEKAKRSSAESAAVLRFFQDQVLAAARPEGQEGGLGTDVSLRKAVDAAEPKIAGAFVEQPTVEASVRQVLGKTYSILGEPTLAIRQLERSHELRMARLGPDHPETLATQNDLALGYWGAGRLDRVIPLLEQTLAAETAKLGPDHPDTLVAQNDVAVAYQEDGRLDRAIPLFERNLVARKVSFGPEHAETLITQANLAGCYRDAGRPDLAIALFERTLATERAKLGPDHPLTLLTENNFALTIQAVGRLNEAIALFERTLAARRVKLGFDHPATLITQNNLAVAYDQAGDDARAEPLFREVLLLRRRRRGAGHPHVAVTLDDLGRYLLRKKRYAEAEPLLHEGLAIWEANRVDGWQWFDAQSLYGGSLLGQGKYAEAESLILSGVEGLKARAARIPAPSKVRLTEAGERVVQLYTAWGKPEKAAEWRATQQRPPSQPEQKP